MPTRGHERPRVGVGRRRAMSPGRGYRGGDRVRGGARPAGGGDGQWGRGQGGGGARAGVPSPPAFSLLLRPFGGLVVPFPVSPSGRCTDRLLLLASALLQATPTYLLSPSLLPPYVLPGAAQSTPDGPLRPPIPPQLPIPLSLSLCFRRPCSAHVVLLPFFDFSGNHSL